ncbi:hypothetical protein O9G_001218 [Rozella allomycis CSF55]|uniref:Uncharacterized protein n=1 Tax=Rozella allomycis (strain CSF55) TaxID=988480 RepID=A0A075AXM2_ROZAC|nr:hypothetical protein O9G_001218 [Rozella allomycis CSF55]|eukprot:EPZ33467.1 hypothetical protein O9G_001218 [Rozella allomycis CSF55]
MVLLINLGGGITNFDISENLSATVAIEFSHFTTNKPTREVYVKEIESNRNVYSFHDGLSGVLAGNFRTTLAL